MNPAHKPPNLEIFSSQAPKFGNFQFTSPKFGNFQFTSPLFQRQVSVRKPRTSEIRAVHPYLKKIWVLPRAMNVEHSGVARTFGAHGQQTLRGPSPYFITLFLWPLPHIHPYSDFANVYLYYMILNTAIFNQYISHGVFWKFGSLWWRNNKRNPLIT